MTELKTRSRPSEFATVLASAAAVVAILLLIAGCSSSGSAEEESGEPVVFHELLGREVVVLDDAANHAYWNEPEGEPSRRIQRWLDALDRIGMRPTTIGSVADWRDGLLVLPHSYCLSDNDVSLIHQGLEEGKGVLFVGPVGVRDSDGTWVGWQRFHSIVGSTNLREYSGLETMFLVVSGTGPVGSLSRAGYRISLLQRSGQWGIAGYPGAAYWADYDRKAFPVDEVFHAAVVGKRDSGRFAWAGFDPDLAAGDSDDQEALDRLLADLVKWSLSVPESEVDLYPNGNSSALFFVMDTEWRFENAAFLADFLESRGIRGGFMCVNEFAAEHPALVRSLGRSHDIGSHSEDHTIFAGQPRRTQVRRLRQAADWLEELSQQPVLGFRPPEEVYDDVTLVALAESGFSYMLGGEATADALPRLLEEPSEEISNRLVLIPRIQRDDLYLANREAFSLAEMSDGLREDWETVRRHRGIHYVSVHSTFITGPEHVAMLGRFLDAVPLDSVWTPGPNELAEWWRNRASIRTELQTLEDGRVLLNVRNEGANLVEGLGVWAAFAGNPRSVRVPIEGVRVDGPDDRGAFLFLLEKLSPGDTLEIPIELVGR